MHAPPARGVRETSLTGTAAVCNTRHQHQMTSRALGQKHSEPLLESAKRRLQQHLPGVLLIARVLRWAPRDARPVLHFIFRSNLPGTTAASRARLVLGLYRVSLDVHANFGIGADGQLCEAPHNQVEILRVAETVLRLPASAAGCLLEGGAFKGAITARLSLIAALAGRRLVVIDSFAGCPPNEEPPALNLHHKMKSFPTGSWAGSLDDVRTTVARFGNLDVCHFIKGWYEETLPGFREPIAVAHLDVSLVASYRTCLRHLWPLVIPGGCIFSREGGLPGVRALLGEERFWREEVGCAQPVMRGLGKTRLIQIVKT